MKKKFNYLILALGMSCSVQAQDLLEIYNLALQNDPVLKQRYFNQYSTGEVRSQSIAQMLPTLSVSAKSGHNRLDNKKFNFQGSGIQNYWNHSFTINFSQPVFHWDHWVQLSQANNKIAKAEADYQAEYQNLMVKTTTAYFNILSAQDSLRFVLAERKAIARQLDQAQQRFEVGLIAITDVYDAQAGFDQSTANLIDANNKLDDTKEALLEIIGDNEINLNKLNKPIDYRLPIPNDIKQWQKIAETNNFTIIAALNQAEVNRKSIDIQKAAHLPTLDVVANYHVEDDNSSFGLRGDTHSVGLQLNLPLFEGGGVVSRTRQAEFDYQASKENLQQIKRQINRQLKDAFRDVISSLSRVKALSAAVKSAASSLEANEAGFEVGTRNMVDVLNEQTKLFRARRDLSRSRYDYLVNGIKLKQIASSLSEQDLQLINQYLSETK